MIFFADKKLYTKLPSNYTNHFDKIKILPRNFNDCIRYINYRRNMFGTTLMMSHVGYCHQAIISRNLSIVILREFRKFDKLS